MMIRILMFFICCACASSAQKVNVPLGVRLSPPGDVPSVVRENFRQDFPNVSATLINLGDDGFEASFKDDSTQLPRRVLYNSTGQKINSHSRVESGSYPALIDNYYLATEPTAKFIVWKFHSYGASPNYYAITGNDTTWFADKGQLLKKSRR